MDFIQVKKFEKYHPNYKDGRSLIWIRWDIAAINDYKISKLTPAQRWLFIGILCLAAKTSNKIPYDLEWITQEIKYQETHISKDFNTLCELELLSVTKCDKMLQAREVDCKSSYPTDRQTDSTDTLIGEFFDYFSLKTKKHLVLNKARRDIISSRLKDYTIDQLKQAVDNFIKDDWPDRHKFMDIVYCIGIRNKVDNLERWLNVDKKDARRIPS